MTLLVLLSTLLVLLGTCPDSLMPKQRETNYKQLNDVVIRSFYKTELLCFEYYFIPDYYIFVNQRTEFY